MRWPGPRARSVGTAQKVPFKHVQSKGDAVLRRAGEGPLARRTLGREVLGVRRLGDERHAVERVARRVSYSAVHDRLAEKYGLVVRLFALLEAAHDVEHQVRAFPARVVDVVFDGISHQILCVNFRVQFLNGFNGDFGFEVLNGNK